MPVRVDLTARRVDAGVRDLLHDDPWAVVAGRSLRAELGVAIHRRVQARHAATPGFRAEVPVRIETTVDTFDVALRGRIDALFDRGDDVLVEEIKSCVEPPTAGSLAEVRAVDQAKLYAWGLRRAGERRPIAVRVRWVSMIDGAEWTSAFAWSEPAVAHLVGRFVRAVIERARVRHARAEALRAWSRALAFPFSTPRPHQLALAGAFADALASGRPVVAAAPTGIGKTVCALVPALRHALQRGVALSWCTARTTQQALVRRTLVACRDRTGPAPLLAITLRAKAASCPPGHLRCHPDACGYLADFAKRVRGSAAVRAMLDNGGIVDPAELDTIGRRERLCPWELARRLARHADVVIGDYNYAFDPSAPTGEAPVVRVIDEAHNLPERARAADSPFVALDAIARARAGVGADATDPSLARELSALLDAVDAFVGGRHAAHRDRPWFEGCRELTLEAARWRALAEPAAALAVRHAAWRRRSGMAGPRDAMSEVLWAIVEIDRVPARAESIAYLARDGARSGAGLGRVGLDSSRRLARVHANATGTLAISATLAPLPAAVADLGLGELDAVTLTVPSPFDPRRLCVCIVDDVDTTVQARPRHYATIAAHVQTVRRVRTGNYVVYAPSYAVLREIARRLPDDPRVLVEVPGASPARRADVLARLRDERGVLLLAVLGGVFAEGVDLPGEACSGAVIVGPGLPPVAFDRQRRREAFDQRHEDGFVRAYAAPAIARVVQAAGRVRRGLEDRGVLVLIGRRFTRAPYAGLLPREWGRPRDLVRRDLAVTLQEFWRDVDARAGA